MTVVRPELTGTLGAVVVDALARVEHRHGGP